MQSMKNSNNSPRHVASNVGQALLQIPQRFAEICNFITLRNYLRVKALECRLRCILVGQWLLIRWLRGWIFAFQCFIHFRLLLLYGQESSNYLPSVTNPEKERRDTRPRR